MDSFINENISIEQVMYQELHPDSRPFTEIEIKLATASVLEFLRKKYPEDSGVWMIKYLYKDKGLVNVVLKPILPSNKMIEKKIMILLE
ncbi:hypothetical protein [Jeotgalibacillus soli]|uniref:Uncharacterized protein n=1 Tax=Jeotgalibacillus soli TaxID=889306 RepID=A0A0C2W9E1_9BACL|nr:hypothetical protein [Jeotgalibacillus soli]KIL52648.1 hypothetical protein KP78_00190 [Jeotgalibacillus soli]